VLISGGLGPTGDDITRNAVADLFERPLRSNERLLAKLRDRFHAHGYREFPETNLSQVEVPEGAIVLDNPNGTAPGLAFEEDSTLVVMLPGVPRELHGIFLGDLSTLLEEWLGDRIATVHHRMLHTTGVPESRLAELIEEAISSDSAFASVLREVSLAYLPDLRGVDLRITSRSVSTEEAKASLDRAEEELDTQIARWRYHAISGDIVESVSDALKDLGLMLAVAESCTGGLVTKRLTDHPGASTSFVGGVIAYDDSVKISALDVSQQDLSRFGAVSEVVAIQMALGASKRLGSDVGLAVTGVAGPGGGTKEKPVGRVWFAVVLNGEERTCSVDFLGDRDAVRERAAQAALAMLLRTL
jgi:nicotinamide-nucleotide amidase